MYLLLPYDNILLAGDVNIHKDEDDIDTNHFKDILNSFNFVQHVDFPTHVAGHTLGIIATLEGNSVISNMETNDFDISHHSLVEFEI